MYYQILKHLTSLQNRIFAKLSKEGILEKTKSKLLTDLPDDYLNRLIMN